MRKALLIIFFSVPIFVSYDAVSQDISKQSCPSYKDLDKGIVYTKPARKGVLYLRHRRLKENYIGKNYINGIYPDGMVVTYGGLFTHKYWSNGHVIQFEKPKTDLTELMKFEVGTEHALESVRFNPQAPDKKWKIASKYKIKSSDDFKLGKCTYKAVRILREGTLTYPDGEVKLDKEEFIFIPELLLKVAKRNLSMAQKIIYYGDVSNVRKVDASDARKWPFTDDAQDVLNK